MELFKTNKNLKKRIFTSIILLTILFLMFLDNFILGYFLIIGGVFCLLEFFKITSIIYNKENYKKTFYNLLFIIFVSIFCSILLIFSYNFSLKIFVFIILSTCVASDMGGFIVGKIFEGPKLTKISPNKTISGSIGSLLFSAILITTATYYFTNNLEIKFLLIGCVVSIGCQIGDLFFSFLKRKANLKDTGNFLPGHGGILDRVDGILLGIPFGFLSLYIIY